MTKYFFLFTWTRHGAKPAGAGPGIVVLSTGNLCLWHFLLVVAESSIQIAQMCTKDLQETIHAFSTA